MKRGRSSFLTLVSTETSLDSVDEKELRPLFIPAERRAKHSFNRDPEVTAASNLEFVITSCRLSPSGSAFRAADALPVGSCRSDTGQGIQRPLTATAAASRLNFVRESCFARHLNDRSVRLGCVR